MFVTRLLRLLCALAWLEGRHHVSWLTVLVLGFFHCIQVVECSCKVQSVTESKWRHWPTSKSPDQYVFQTRSWHQRHKENRCVDRAFFVDFGSKRWVFALEGSQSLLQVRCKQNKRPPVIPWISHTDINTQTNVQVFKLHLQQHRGSSKTEQFFDFDGNGWKSWNFCQHLLRYVRPNYQLLQCSCVGFKPAGYNAVVLKHALRPLWCRGGSAVKRPISKRSRLVNNMSLYSKGSADRVLNFLGGIAQRKVNMVYFCQKHVVILVWKTNIWIETRHIWKVRLFLP